MYVSYADDHEQCIKKKFKILKNTMLDRWKYFKA